MYNDYPDISELVGKTFTKVFESGDVLNFEMEDGTKYVFNHHQNCCESVYIESIVGDLDALVGSPIFLAEENSGDTPSDYKFEYEPESYTWTFYKFATFKGYVDVRWLGTSNGHYGEGVSLDVYRP